MCIHMLSLILKKICRLDPGLGTLEFLNRHHFDTSSINLLQPVSKI